MTADTSDGARPSIPSPAPVISDTVVEAAARAILRAVDSLADIDTMPPGDRTALLECAHSAIVSAIAADREEHSACELCDVEAPWRELVANLRGQISEFITQNEGLKALLRSEVEAFRADREASRAEIERLTKELANARANSVSRGKMLIRLRDELIGIRDKLDDQGDLVVFGSTNDADDFKEAVDRLDSFKWDMILREKNEDDILAKARKANKRAAEAEAKIEELTKAPPCGHHHSLALESVESDVVLCELCEARSERNDAVLMEAEYRAKFEEASDSLSIAEQATRTALESIPIAMTAAVAEAVELLRPFASEVDLWGHAVPDDHKPVSVEMGHWDARYYGSPSAFSLGDLRAARAFVEKHSPAIRKSEEPR